MNTGTWSMRIDTAVSTHRAICEALQYKKDPRISMDAAMALARLCVTALRDMHKRDVAAELLVKIGAQAVDLLIFIRKLNCGHVPH